MNGMLNPTDTHGIISRAKNLHHIETAISNFLIEFEPEEDDTLLINMYEKRNRLLTEIKEIIDGY